MPGKVESKRTFFDIKNMIKDLVDFFKDTANQKGIDLNINISPNVPNQIKSYDLLTKSILANLNW